MTKELSPKEKGQRAIQWIEKLMTAEQDGVKQGIGMLGDAELGYCCLGYG